MARKSRKENIPIKPDYAKPPVTMAAGYVRLSVEDRHRLGNSIENQILIIRNFVAANDDVRLYDLYVDNGLSGRTLERPAFKRMLNDLEQGNIKCVIVKDLSRFGRDAVDSGEYIEKLFPSKGIRFIAISDSYDSAKVAFDTRLALQGIVNEFYSADIGRKVKNVFELYMQMGKYVGVWAPYGYIKSPEDCHKLIVDEPAAQVVRQIFQRAVQGETAAEISRALNETAIPTPSQHRFQQGIIENSNLLGNVWLPGTIEKILSNEVYIGNLVQGKSKRVYQGRAAQPAHQWIRVENTHEAIISKDIYNMVNSKKLVTFPIPKPSIKNPKPETVPNLFKGKVICAKCGRKMQRKKNHEKNIFRCTGPYIAPGTCEGNSIAEDVLVEYVAEEIGRYLAIGPEESSIDLKAIETALVRVQLNLWGCTRQTKVLFEQSVFGKLDKELYAERKNKIGERTALLRDEWAELIRQKSSFDILDSAHKKMVSLYEEYKGTGRLAQELVNGLIGQLHIKDENKVHIELAVQNIG